MFGPGTPLAIPAKHHIIVDALEPKIYDVAIDALLEARLLVSDPVIRIPHVNATFASKAFVNVEHDLHIIFGKKALGAILSLDPRAVNYDKLDRALVAQNQHTLARNIPRLLASTFDAHFQWPSIDNLVNMLMDLQLGSTTDDEAAESYLDSGNFEDDELAIVQALTAEKQRAWMIERGMRLPSLIKAEIGNHHFIPFSPSRKVPTVSGLRRASRTLRKTLRTRVDDILCCIERATAILSPLPPLSYLPDVDEQAVLPGSYNEHQSYLPSTILLTTTNDSTNDHDAYLELVDEVYQVDCEEAALHATGALTLRTAGDVAHLMSVLHAYEQVTPIVDELKTLLESEIS